jgi:aerobic carbon-monoxide dehydrogenase medium subunit
MKAAAFTYLAAESVDEAVGALAELGDGARVLAGGQSLLAMMNLRLAQPETLIDIRRCGLGGVTAAGALEIGAMTTQTDAMGSPEVRRHCPLLARALADVSHAAIRNRGTVGGSVAHADPAAEIPAVLVAAAGEVTARSVRGQRTILAEDLFVSHYETSLADDEVLTSVCLPFSARRAWTFHEITRRRGDFALAGVAATFALDPDGVVAEARIVLFALADRPLRACDAEAALIGRPLGDADSIDAAAEAGAAVVDAYGDIHGGAAYRRHLAGVALRRALRDTRTGA